MLQRKYKAFYILLLLCRKTLYEAKYAPNVLNDKTVNDKKSDEAPKHNRFRNKIDLAENAD